MAWTAPNEQSLILKVNGVVQHTDAYSIAGSPTTITLASGNFADGATVEVVGINDIGTAIVPADGSVTRPKLATTGTPDGSKFLQDDMAWTTVDSLPSQTGESGKFLTTSGSAASWGTVDVRESPNLIINGYFDVWQRGTSFSISGAGPGEYNVDRWKFAGNNFTGSLNRTAFTTNQTDVPDCPAYYARWINTTTMPAAQKNQFLTPIEATGGFKLANQEVTFSCWLRSVSGTIPDGNVTLIQESAVYPSVGAITTTWTKFTHTWTIWNSTGPHMWIGFEVPATYSLTNGLDIAHCQLEFGSVATSFKSMTFAQELQACKRYFQIPYNWWAHSDGSTATAWKFVHDFPVEMRAAPTLAASGSMVSNQMNNNVGGPTLVTVPGTANKTGFQLSYTTVATGTGTAAGANYPYQGYGGWSADAEL